MTEDQFKKIVSNAFTELNKDNNVYNCVTFVYNVEEMVGTLFGYGCPGCAAEAIKDDLKSGRITHRIESDLHREKVM